MEFLLATNQEGRSLQYEYFLGPVRMSNHLQSYRREYELRGPLVWSQSLPHSKEVRRQVSGRWWWAWVTSIVTEPRRGMINEANEPASELGLDRSEIIFVGVRYPRRPFIDDISSLCHLAGTRESLVRCVPYTKKRPPLRCV